MESLVRTVPTSARLFFSRSNMCWGKLEPLVHGCSNTCGASLSLSGICWGNAESLIRESFDESIITVGRSAARWFCRCSDYGPRPVACPSISRLLDRRARRPRRRRPSRTVNRWARARALRRVLSGYALSGGMTGVSRPGASRSTVWCRRPDCLPSLTT